MVSAPMHLQSNTSLIDVQPLFFLPFHDLDLVDPCGDVGRVADNAGSTFIPMAMSPEVWPRIGQNGLRDGRLPGGFGGDLLHSLLETIIADMGVALESFTINTHHIPACVIVNHRLPSSVLRKKSPLSGPKSLFISITISKSSKLASVIRMPPFPGRS